MTSAMIDLVNQNQVFLNGMAGFISGACLMYLVLARTLRKRRLEESEAAAA